MRRLTLQRKRRNNVFKKIKKMFIWLFSRKVGEAINNGATYEEVCEIVQEELEK